jgi:hypothetical protein
MTERGSLIPTSVREDDDVLHATFSLLQENLTTTLSTSNDTHSEYVRALSKDRQRLLMNCWSPHPHSTTKLLREHIKSNRPLECGSDGGLANGYGSMGFAVTTGKDVLWKGSGPVDGATETASSRRSELLALPPCLNFSC